MRTTRSTSERDLAALYRAGAVSAAVAVVLYVAGLVMVVATTAPPESGAAEILQYVHAHRAVYIARQLLWTAPNLFLMVVFLALAVALRGHGRGLAAVAGVVAVSSWAVAFAWPTSGDGSLAMVVLSDRYAEASAGQRPSLVAGAELLDALNDVPAVIGVLQTLGLLLIALLMLRGTFSPWLARLGVVTGVVGIGSEVLRPVLGGAYAVYGLLLFAWLAWVAVALWQLSLTPKARRIG
ncbi:hypothetical protein ASC64_20900 [Nocardioides sp. Root122]|uniref:DUF4386 family protein n=1 Tax=Nocardioides TaxID=1839 RepID=UPI000702C94D|nr:MULTISPECIES: DUF4386 family protein [Nocardioides]KQV72080.1 hypothetical protein ASC64_20900 [Nocardioides sp. Root122]MCK9824715.1 DUF4386 family protein [Nocardioides cavernae]